MDKELMDINLGEIIGSAMERPYGPLAIAVIGIVAVFGIYMSYTSETTINPDLM